MLCPPHRSVTSIPPFLHVPVKPMVQAPAFSSMQFIRLVLPSIAWTVAHPAASNASAPPIADPSNSSLADHARATGCFMPSPAVNTWWYNTRTDGPHRCYGPPYQTWAMLNSYRSGGTIGVHWKYTDDVFDQECLFGWGYYTGDGERLMATVLARITVEGDTRSWCALSVYVSGANNGSTAVARHLLGVYPHQKPLWVWRGAVTWDQFPREGLRLGLTPRSHM